MFDHAGMDAQVAYGFHSLRNERPYLAQGPIANKVGLIILFLHFLVSHASFPMSILVLFLLNCKILLKVGWIHEVKTNQ